jgi:hypothetical protein
VNSSLTEPRRGHPRRSATDRFEDAFRRCQTLLGSPEDPELSVDGRRLLRQLVDDPRGVALT